MSELVDSVVAAVREAGAALRGGGVPTEVLAAYVAPRRKLLIPRAATMRPLGEVWRVGTLLIGADPEASPALLIAGKTTRAAVRPHPGNQSVSREQRRDLAAAALHGGYTEGTTVNFDAQLVALDEPALLALPAELPLGVVAGELRVRWRAGAPLEGAQTLASYLAERVELLVHPPQGAN
ncbi:hypothetical protein ACFSWE_15150 [Leucobacter albus]|uniref:Glutaminase n=1 Tax=Leucobacter albus TaxID=272210 RepID=A0ABW3TQ08_9MICO